MSLWWCVLLLASMGTITASTGEEVQQVQRKTRERRFTGFESPTFERDVYQVMESNATLEGLVCVTAGADERFLSIFSARGLPEKCPRFPCPQATEGEDFLPVRMLEFFLKPRERTCLDVTLLDDRMIEGREFFLIVLQDLQWGEITSTTVVTINDDDDPSLLLSSQFVMEDVGVAMICLQGGIEPVTLIMEVLNTSTAQTTPHSPPDFIVLNEGVEKTVEPGSSTCFNIVIMDDELDEDSEDIFLAFFVGNGSNSSTVLLSSSIKIIDNDFAPSFESFLHDVQEDAGQVEVCVTFQGDPTTTVTSHLETHDGTALDGSDYRYYESTFNISGGERSCHNIELINNSITERTESFSISVNSSNSVAQPPSTIVQVIDDDVLDFVGSVRQFFVVESDIVLDICVTALSGSTDVTLQGYIYTEPISAKIGEDFRDFGGIGGAVRGVRFVFEKRERMCFPLVILQDRQPENQERLRLRLLTISNGRVLRVVTAYLTIRDDDAMPCPDLNPPTNGRITSLSDSTNPGSIALYQCNVNFELVGEARRECQASGIWTGPEPRCLGSDPAGLDRNI